MMYRQEQGKAELRSAWTMPGGLSVTLALDKRMLELCVNNWKDSREMVSLVYLKCCSHVKRKSD